MGLLDSFVLGYGLLSLTHLFIQINLAHSEFLKHHKDSIDYGFNPSVGIVIPSYNEDYKSLREAVLSCLQQQYENLQVVLVDDGSKQEEAFVKVVEDFKDNQKFSGIRLIENQGKRCAQKHAFDQLADKVELIVTIDSDTILAADGVRAIIQQFKNPEVGAVTGNVRAIHSKGLLPKLIDGRYFSAFNQERAAQSLFGEVLCCSGPFSAYRSSIISQVKDKYIAQVFLGQKCTYGDDRHLTNLVLDLGYQVMYESKAHAVTYVPSTIKGFIKQQIRWNKSFYRELIWTVKSVVKTPGQYRPYIIYDLTMQTILPFLLMSVLVVSFIRGFTASPLYILQYLITVAGVALIRTAYSFYRTGDKNLLLFPLYSFLHIFLLLPARIYAISTMKVTRWGTR
jgi:cellulose synthase/poly-beta-1,6-N-acetylglucosamine synthase-like glycosyltransferase